MNDAQAAPLLLSRDAAQLLIIDVQQRLVPHIHDHAAVVAQVIRVIRAAAELDVPVMVSEQYPQGLGPTDPAILAAADRAEHVQKLTFSCCRTPEIRSRLLERRRPQILLAGIETHVCVLQTAIDLLEAGCRPYVLADAVGSRRVPDRDAALEFMRAAGVAVTTVESAIYQLMERAGTELFKRILPLVK